MTVPKARAAPVHLWLCALCAPPAVEALPEKREVAVCAGCGQVAKNPTGLALETVLLTLRTWWPQVEALGDIESAVLADSDEELDPAEVSERALLCIRQTGAVAELNAYIAKLDGRAEWHVHKHEYASKRCTYRVLITGWATLDLQGPERPSAAEALTAMLDELKPVAAPEGA